MALSPSKKQNVAKQVKFLPGDRAELIVAELVNSQYKHLNSEDEQILLTRLIKACSPVEINGKRYYQLDTLKAFLGNLRKAIETKDPTILSKPRGRKFRPVDVQEFIESKEYYGQAGHVWPTVLEELWEIFHGVNDDGTPRDYVEIVFGGAIGIGKNYRAELVSAYTIYDLSSYYSPQLEFDLAPGSAIVGIQQSKSLSLARKVVFDQFAARLRSSPYFKKNFMFDSNVKAELRFPNNINIYPLGGNDTAAFGMNVYFGCFPGQQTYVKSDGNLERFDAMNQTVRVKTLNDQKNIVESNETRSVKTGFKRLVRLSFLDGSSIICSPDQKFKDEYDNWIEAKDCSERRLRASALSDLRKANEISDSSFDRRTQYEQQRVSSEISDSECLWQTHSEELPEARRKGCLSSLWRAVSHDNINACAISRNDVTRISTEVCGLCVEIARRNGNLESQVERSCDETASRSRIQESNTTRDDKDLSIRTSEVERTSERSRVDSKGFSSRQECLEKSQCSTEGSDLCCRCQRENVGQQISAQNENIQEARRSVDSDGFFVGDCCCLLVRLEQYCLGLRNNDVPLSIPECLALLCSRLQSDELQSVSRSQRFLLCELRRQMARETEDMCRSFACFHERRCKNIESIEDIQLAVSQSDKEDIISANSRSIRLLECTSVEELARSEEVYDIECVNNSHLFFTPLTNSDNALCLEAKNCLDEMNFLLRTTESVVLQYTGEKEFDQAERLYSQTIRRIRSRYMQVGKNPGKLILVSSANYPGDFIDRKAKEAETDPTIFVSIKAQWEMRRPETMSPEKFYVERGTDTYGSRIIVSPDMARPGAQVLEIPLDWKSDFERDIEGALRDCGGRPTGINSPFITSRESIEEGQVAHEQTYGGVSLFTSSEVVFPESGDFDLTINPATLVNQDYVDTVILPDQVFACHIDVGVTGDALGLAIGHIHGYKRLADARIYNDSTQSFVEMTDVYAPVYTIDGVLRCVAAHGGEVDINQVVRLVLYIHSLFGVRWATADTYQSTQALQSFKRAGIRSGPLSVDTNLGPYSELRDALKEKRCFIPRNATLAAELTGLQRIVEKNKLRVDHPKNGSKDCSDAVAGVVYMLQHKEARYKRARREERRTETPTRVIRMTEGRLL